jgi:hypothetical protein
MAEQPRHAHSPRNQSDHDEKYGPAFSDSGARNQRARQRPNDDCQDDGAEREQHDTTQFP